MSHKETLLAALRFTSAHGDLTRDQHQELMQLITDVSEGSGWTLSAVLKEMGWHEYLTLSVGEVQENLAESGLDASEEAVRAALSKDTDYGLPDSAVEAVYNSLRREVLDAMKSSLESEDYRSYEVKLTWELDATERYVLFARNEKEASVYAQRHLDKSEYFDPEVSSPNFVLAVREMDRGDIEPGEQVFTAVGRAEGVELRMPEHALALAM